MCLRLQTRVEFTQVNPGVAVCWWVRPNGEAFQPPKASGPCQLSVGGWSGLFTLLVGIRGVPLKRWVSEGPAAGRLWLLLRSLLQ